MKMKQTILTLLLTFFGLSAYADEITVYDGTVEAFNTPFCGYNASNGTRSQYIIPADLLANVEGCDITKLTFYSPSNYASRSFDEGVTVYLKEVGYTTFASTTFEDWSSMTPVYTGTIGVGSDSHTVIDFDSPYSYNGGNLMIGFQVTTWGTTSQYVRWYSVESTFGTSLYENAGTDHSWSGSGTRQSYAPKTTLTYEEASTTCPKPANLTASVTNSHTATLTWESDFTSFNLRYKVSSEESWTEVNNLTTKSHTLSTLSPETNYTVQVQAVGNNETSKWASVSFSTPSSVPAPTELTCTAKSSTLVTLGWTQNGEETAWQICLDNDEEHLINVSQNPYTFTNLITGQAYTAKVRAVNSTGDEYSKWSNVVSFRLIDELTVSDGTETDHTVPMYIYNYEENYVRNQYIVPASDLKDMAGGTISSITLYTTSSYMPYTTAATIDVYLKEVNFTTFTYSNFVDKATATTVYQGQINFVNDGTGGSATITFTTPYQYNGENLLIGFDNTTKAEKKFISFYGTKPSYYSAAYQYSTEMDGLSSETAIPKSFSPKTTFIYTAFTGVLKPTNLQVSDITAHAATVTWKGRLNTFNLRYKESTATDWTEVNGLTTKSYNLTNLRSGKSYEVQIQTVDYDETSDWASVSFNTIAMPTPTPLFCATVTSTSATLEWVKKGDENAWQISLNGDETNLINATTNPYTLTGLTTGQEYSAKVRAINSAGDEWSEWSDAVSFTPTGLLTLTPPVIEGYEGVYDGEPHQFRVVSNPDQATLRFSDYSINNITSTAAQMGYRTNAGTYTYYWQATKEGYNTVTGSVQVIIHKAQGTLKYDITTVDKFADDDSFINPLTKTGDGTVTYSSYNPDFATVSETGLVTIHGIGWTDIIAEVTDGQNYTYANKEAKYGLAMTKKKADSYKARIVVWLNNGVLTDLTFDSEPEMTYDESTRLVSVTGTTLAWPLKNMRKLTFTRALPNFTFNEEDDNSGVVIDGYQCDFTLNRTFRTGSYNTFAVPFDVTIPVLKEVMGEETTVKELTASSLENTRLIMTFADASTIEAGKPYFINVPADVVNPTFKDVIVRNVSTPIITNYVNVIPAIGKTLVKGYTGSEDDAQSVLYLSGGNQFKHPTVVNQPDNEDSYLKGFRAYFQLHDGATMASISSNLTGNLTGIVDVRNRMEDGRKDIYDMQGRKVQNPTKKGIYIINGKKVVIR